MLAEFIRQSGRRQTAWARDFGISEPYLSALATGRKTPSLAVAIRIERATEGAVPASSWIPDTTRGAA